MKVKLIKEKILYDGSILKIGTEFDVWECEEVENGCLAQFKYLGIILYNDEYEQIETPKIRPNFLKTIFDKK